MSPLKVMLLSPPTHTAIKGVLEISGLPLGLAYIASVLEEAGHEVRIVDSVTLDYGMDDIKRELRRFAPDFVGLTGVTSTIYDVYNIAGAAKEVNPECKVAAGGPHVTFTSRETLSECPEIDFVVRGEGEETSRELVSALERGSSLRRVRGISFRNNGEIAETPHREFIQDIDSMPFPAFHLLPMNRYHMGGERFGMIMTSRGCPFSCTFCSSSQLYGKTWRARSSENVVEELKLLKYKYGLSEIEFMDDTFTLNNKRAMEICDLMVKEKLDITWTCSSRVNTINRELTRKLKKAGCHTLYFGIESGSSSILRIINKGTTLEQASRAVRLAREVGVGTLGSFIIGIPGETLGTIKKTIGFAKKLNPSLAQFTLFTPYPGTALFKRAREKGLILTKDWSKYTTLDPVMRIPGMPPHILKKMLRKAYLSFYLRPSFIMKQVQCRNFFVIKKAVKAAINYVKSY